MKTPFELTPTERRVLELHNTGLSGREIARALGRKRANDMHTVLVTAREKERLRLMSPELVKRQHAEKVTTLKTAHGRSLRLVR